jgi:hypothetical protein
MKSLILTALSMFITTTLSIGFIPIAYAQGAHAFAEITRPEPARNNVPSNASSNLGENGQLNAEGSGETYICAAYDVKNQRCLVRKMTEAQRNSAINTGLEVVNSMGQIQRDAWGRVNQQPRDEAIPNRIGSNPQQRQTIGTSARGQKLSQANPQRGESDWFAACVDTRLSTASRKTGANPTPQQEVSAIEECSK